MKKLLCFIVLITGLSCKKNQTSIKNNDTYEIPISKSINKTNRIFKLDRLSKVEILSYPNRILWDTISFNGMIPFDKELISNNKLTFESKFIKERINLNKEQILELTQLMSSDSCEPKEMVAACYMPRHLILFKDKKDTIIAYNEICIECVGSRYSSNIEVYQKYCMTDMKDFFKKVGIKYFGKNGE